MDKYLHYIGGAIAGLIGAAILVGSPFLGAVLFSGAAGILKEMADAHGPFGLPKTGFDWSDVFATLLGGVAIGVLCVLIPSIPEYLASTDTLF